MTEAQKELYIKTKARLRRIGAENPADVIVALAEELDKYKVMNHLLERDIADRDEMLEKKVEEIYPEFMRDYNAMRNDLNGAYDDLEDLSKNCDELREELKAAQDALLREQMKSGDQSLRLTPEKPVIKADEFGDRSLSCPHCGGPVTNYWVPGTKPKHCQFCGQALDWGEEAKG